MDILEASESFRSGQLEKARELCLQILNDDPKSAVAEQLLGRITNSEGELDAAESHLQRAFELDSKLPGLGHELAQVLVASGKHAAAVDVLKTFLQSQPQSAGAHHLLGTCLEQLGKLRLAIRQYRESVVLSPSNAEWYWVLGRALRKVGNSDRAVAAFREAIALRRSFRPPWHALAAAYAERGSIERAIDTEREQLKLPNPSSNAFSNLLYKLYYLSRMSGRDLLKESLEWGNRIMRDAGEALPRSKDEDSGRRLRIGYLSPDFREHPVGRLLEPVLAGHNRETFEVFCYSNLRLPGDAMTQRFKCLDVIWRDVLDLSDSQLSSLIRADRIDLLIETSGHFGDNRLAALATRPAPVQINGFGWCGTTGLRAIDFRLTDPLSDPPGETDQNYTERLVRMPDCAWVYRPFDGDVVLAPVPAVANGFVTFGNLNNPVKTSPEAARLWARILAQIPDSKLKLLCSRGTETLTRRRFADLGVHPNRLVLSAGRPRRQYMQLFDEIDVALDPFPFNGDNCTCDALWMGVPVVSLVGNAYHSRRGLSHLTAVGLGDLAVSTPSEYVDAAVVLSRNLPRLQMLRATLRERLIDSPLGDTVKYCRELETIYKQLWNAWCSS